MNLKEKIYDIVLSSPHLFGEVVRDMEVELITNKRHASYRKMVSLCALHLDPDAQDSLSSLRVFYDQEMNLLSATLGTFMCIVVPDLQIICINQTRRADMWKFVSFADF